MAIIRFITTALCGGGIIWLCTAYFTQQHGHAVMGQQSSIILLVYFAVTLAVLYGTLNSKYKTFFHWFTLVLAIMPFIYLFWTLYALKNIFNNF